MKTWLFNPFRYVAGGKSLLYGLKIMLATAVIGYLSNTHFPDIISVKTSPDFPVTYFILQAVINWLILSSLLYFAALLVSGSSIRVIDIFGTQALARTPYFLAAFIGFSSSVTRFGEYLVSMALQNADVPEPPMVDKVLAVAILAGVLLLTIWTVALMFNAFRVSANARGSKAVGAFILAFIASMTLSGFVNSYLLNAFGR